MSEQIGTWDSSRLMQFVRNIVTSSPASLPRAMTLQNLTTTQKLTVGDQLELSPQAVEYLRLKLGL